MLMTKTLAVSAIKNGVVIDHIPAGQALYLVRLLKLSDRNKQVTLAINLKSGSKGYKDIVKLEEYRLTADECAKIAVICPNATLNTIENYEVTDKSKVVLPDRIDDIFPCPNDKCISNHEPMSASFLIQEYRQGIRLRCHYCNKCFSQEDALPLR
ncbi:MAG: aspartate carbamoyltransferase regulatory subunit [Chlamydiota bacterium]|nr:aspartate carbamoyltransferase regulatory subunit [Chlamydiota bacterium]